MKLSEATVLISSVLGTVLVGGALVLPRAYSTPKLVILILLLIVLLINNLARGGVFRAKRVLVFYSLFAATNMFGIVVGLMRGNSNEALIDGFRIGVIFSIIIALLWNFLADFQYDKFLGKVIEISAICISVLVFLAFFQELIGAQIFSESFILENNIRVGLHDGYVQVVSSNIASLFFISGYLIYYLASRHDGRNRFLASITLVLVISTAILSGRRALLFIIILSPIFIIATSVAFSEYNQMKMAALRFWGFFMIALAALLVYVFVNDYFSFDSFIERIVGVFENEGGARTSQAEALFSGFLSQPLFGSGIGGVVEVIRSVERPWSYELTYLQLLFNFGFVAFFVIGILFFKELMKIRLNSKTYLIRYSIEQKSMLNGAFFLLAGAVSNPYLSSFEFLLVLGVIPFLASGGGRTRSLIS
jgi:hypothetical protein